MGKFSHVLQKALSESGHASRSAEDRRPAIREDSNSERCEPVWPQQAFAPDEEDARATTLGLRHLADNRLLIAGRQDGSIETRFAAEQFKTLCSQLVFPLDRAPAKSIMITSSIPGEGKSTVCANLAVTMALRKQEHILLIECDLRRPSLAKFFGFNNSRGVADYLMQTVELPSVIAKTPIDNLTILPAGHGTRQPFELLTSRRMKDLLEELKDRYKDAYLILDSSPARVAPETAALSQIMDGVILVVRYGMASRKVIQEAVSSIGKNKIVGVVFNDLRSFYSNRYYHQYYGRKK